MQDTVVVLVAPSARGWTDPALTRISDAGFRVREVACRSDDDIRSHAARWVAEGAQTLVVAGDDNAVHEALQELAGSATRLGIIPTGEGNHSRIADMFGIGEDPLAAADLIIGSRVREVDLGRASGTWFASSLTTGFDGRRSQLHRAKPARYQVSAPSTDVRRDAVTIEVRPVGDGLLEAVAFLRRRDVLTHRGTTLVRAAEVAVAAPAVMAWADGVRIGPLPLHVTVAAKALRIITP